MIVLKYSHSTDYFRIFSRYKFGVSETGWILPSIHGHCKLANFGRAQLQKKQKNTPVDWLWNKGLWTYLVKNSGIMGYPFRRKYLLTNTVDQPVQWDEMGLFFTAHWFCLKKGHHQLQGWSSIFFHVVFGYNSFWDKPRLWETSLGRFKIGVFFFFSFL